MKSNRPFILILSIFLALAFSKPHEACLLFSKQYNLSRLIMGTDKHDDLQEIEKLKAEGFIFTESKGIFRLLTYKEAYARFKVILEKNKDLASEKDTLIDMDWDRHSCVKPIGKEFGVIHLYPPNKLVIIKLTTMEKKQKPRTFEIEKCTEKELVLYDMDNPGLYAHYYFLIKNIRK